VSSACGFACQRGFGDCNGRRDDGCESALTTDVRNCGGCGRACGAGQSCAGGACTSATGYRSYVIGPTPQPFVDACREPGHAVVLRGVDDSTETAMLPFVFTLYRTRSSSPWISSNGIVGFGSAPSASFSASCMPSASGVTDPAVFAFWDDLQTRAGGVCWVTRGAAPNRQFVVTWSDLQFCCGDSPTEHLTFSLVFNETSERIDVLYSQMTDTDTSGGSMAARASGERALIAVQDTSSATMTTFACQRVGAVPPTPSSFAFIPVR
jgi:hypothetical protein